MKKQKLIKVTASMDLPVGSVGTAVPAGYNGEMAIIFEGKDLGLYGFDGSSWSLIYRYQAGDIHYLYSGGMERYYVMSFIGQEEAAKLSFFSTGNISSSIPRISSTLEETKLQDINEVPPYTAGDENKMLTVLSDGSLAWLLSNQNYIVDADGNYGETIEVPVSPWDSYSFIEERNDVTWGSNSSLINGIANIGNSIGINGSALNVNGLGAAGPFRSILQSNSYSVSMWINFTDITSNGQWGVGLFADQYRGVGSGINFFYISTSKFSCNEQVLSFPGLNSGTWRHVVFSRNGNASKIYVDGVLVGTINVANFNWRADSGLQFGNACYGSRDNGINPLNGMMDRIQIIDYPLIDTEVTQLYNEGYAIIN